MTHGVIKLAGTVAKLIDRKLTREPEQAQISLAGAGFMYDELRVPNSCNWKVGDGIEVTIRPV
jgi:hypothetical protein